MRSVTSSEYSQLCIDWAVNNWKEGQGRADVNEFLTRDDSKLDLRVPSIWMVWNVSNVILESPPELITVDFIDMMVRRYFDSNYVKAHGEGRYHHVMNKLSIVGFYSRAKKGTNSLYEVPEIIKRKGMLWFYADNKFIIPKHHMHGLPLPGTYRDVGGKIGNITVKNNQ